MKIENKIKLKQCPFCGGDADLWGASGGGINDMTHWVSCTKCYCGTDVFGSESEAVESWNSRVIENIKCDCNYRKLREVHLTDSYGICDIIGGINEIIRFINAAIIPSLQNKEEKCEEFLENIKKEK